MPTSIGTTVHLPEGWTTGESGAALPPKGDPSGLSPNFRKSRKNRKNRKSRKNRRNRKSRRN